MNTCDVPLSSHFIWKLRWSSTNRWGLATLSGPLCPLVFVRLPHSLRGGRIVPQAPRKALSLSWGAALLQALQEFMGPYLEDSKTRGAKEQHGDDTDERGPVPEGSGAL